MQFSYYNVEFVPLTSAVDTIVKGEASNDTTRNYNIVLLRIFVYRKDVTIGKGIIKIYDFRAGAKKYFEAIVDLNRSQISEVTRYEILFEHGY